jgi:hypothetical protein
MSEKEREAQIMDAVRQAERLRGQTFEAAASLDAIEAARRQLSVANDELRGQNTVLRNRINWLISEMDRLAAEVKQLKDAPP